MNSAPLGFADARWLWVLVPIFVLWLIAEWGLPRLRAALGRPAHATLRFPTLARITPLPHGLGELLVPVLRLMRWLTVALILAAILRPQTGRTLTSVNTEGIDVISVIDTSGSMRALDLDAEERSIAKRRNRLEVAQEVVADFVAARPNDQLGLVVFGEHAFTQCPLTLDHDVLGSLLARLEIGMAGDATAIGDAIGIAIKRLRDSMAESKVIVLLTDGRSNAGALDPLTAAAVAATFGIKIYTIAVGALGEAPFLVDTPFGPQVRYENVEIDEAMLQAIAQQTDAAYFRAQNADALAQIYAQIDQLEKTELTMESFTEYDDRYEWLVVPALILMLGDLALRRTRGRVLP